MRETAVSPPLLMLIHSIGDRCIDEELKGSIEEACRFPLYRLLGCKAKTPEGVTGSIVGFLRLYGFLIAVALFSLLFSELFFAVSLPAILSLNLRGLIPPSLLLGVFVFASSGLSRKIYGDWRFWRIPEPEYVFGAGEEIVEALTQRNVDSLLWLIKDDWECRKKLEEATEKVREEWGKLEVYMASSHPNSDLKGILFGVYLIGMAIAGFITVAVYSLPALLLYSIAEAGYTALKRRFLVQFYPLFGRVSYLIVYYGWLPSLITLLMLIA